MDRSIARWAAPIVALATLALALPASAATNRIWVSGHGVDQAGCSAPINPCRSLQYAHDHVATGGEIDILDPAGYGAVAITKAVSIVNDGVGTAGVQATSGAAISINAGAGAAVFLRGLNVDGVQHAGADGLVLVSAGSLTIEHCVFRYFSQNGVDVEPSTGALQLLVRDSDVSENQQAGIVIQPSVTASVVGALDRVAANGNTTSGFYAIGSSTTGTIKLSITNSLATNTTDNGFNIQSGFANVDVTMDSDIAAANAFGLFVFHSAVAHLARSVLNENGTGIDLLNGGTVFTSGDNQVHGNITDLTGGSLVSEALR